MLDHLITELDNRFEETAALSILPSELVSSSVQLNPSHFKEVLQLYKDDPFHQLRQCILSWIYGKRNETVKAKQLDTPTKALSFVDNDYFPNIYVILVISTTLPVTSCACERTISMLKLLKNHYKAPWVTIN